MLKKIRFGSSILYVVGLLLANILLIVLQPYISYEGLLFLGNVMVISLLFPAVKLYLDQKENFSLKRYLYFALMTFIALFVVCELFVYRLI